MKINIGRFECFVIGSMILIPLNFFVLNTQVFYVQTLLMIFLSLFLVFENRKIGVKVKRSSLTMDVLVYLAWILISFLANLIFSLDDLETQGRRVISMGIALLLMSGFFVGRNWRGMETNTRSLVRGICFTYLIVMLLILIYFLSQASLDLYVVRRFIGQRLPFVIGFVSCLAATYFFLGKPRKLYYLFIMSSGLAAVAFSLTRAAYIQVFISFLILFMKEIRKYFFRVIFIVALLGLSGVVGFNFFREYPAVKQIAARFELLVDVEAQSKVDESGSFRLEMWRFLINKLLDDPARLVAGYGQLGPTQVAKEFVPTVGETGNNAHNQYLDTVVREGLVGLAIFLWICYRSLKLGFSTTGIPGDAKLFIMANSIGLAGVMFYGFFHETFRYPLFGFYFWLYLGILSRIVENRTVTDRPRKDLNESS